MTEPTVDFSTILRQYEVLGNEITTLRDLLDKYCRAHKLERNYEGESLRVDQMSLSELVKTIKFLKQFRGIL